MKINRQRRTELATRMFQLLYEHPAGLSMEGIVAQLEESVPLTAAERRPHHVQASRSAFEEALWTGTIAPAKAGWLENKRGHLSLTTEGRAAFRNIGDRFIAEAASRSIKGRLSVTSPGAYRRATGLVDRVLIEYRLARRVGLRQLLGKSENGSSWENVLPIQAPQRFKLHENVKNLASVVDNLKSTGLRYFEGGHAIYIPPQLARQSVFEELLRNYPADAGIKLIKHPGGVDESHYLRTGFGAGVGESVMQKNVVYDHRRLTLVANLLCEMGIGTRLYDLIELQASDCVMTAYVVEHAGERVPSMEECEAGLRRIEELEREDVLRVNLPDGFADEDFECPNCNGNAVMSRDGKFRYVDFQNFLLVNYENYLEQIAREATEKSHFGDRNVLRGGTYLYQSIPGVHLPSRRKIDDRMVVLSELMKKAGLSLEHRMVLDVGCNIGGMMGQYLKLGARWCHGWDRDYVTPHTERLLRALGCTRFSTSGGDINQETDLTQVPEFAQALLDGCVISYLAVRGHLGWLKALGRIPWSFMIYEGHEDETANDFEEHLNGLRQLAEFRTAAIGTYADGDSDQRFVAILQRL